MLGICQYDGYILVSCKFYTGSCLSPGQLVISLSLGQVYCHGSPGSLLGICSNAKYFIGGPLVRKVLWATICFSTRVPNSGLQDQ